MQNVYLEKSSWTYLAVFHILKLTPILLTIFSASEVHARYALADVKGNVQAPYKVILLKGGGNDVPVAADYPVCKEMLKILNLPENAQAFGYRMKIKDIVFPKTFKNFKQIEWDPIQLDEVKKLYPPGYIDKVIAAEREYAVNFEKDWDGKGDFTFEKTMVNYDGPQPQTMIRYRFSTMGKGNCILPQDASGAAAYFNPTAERGARGKPSSDCGLFQYGGKFYRASTFTKSWLDVSKFNDAFEPGLCNFHKIDPNNRWDQ